MKDFQKGKTGNKTYQLFPLCGYALALYRSCTLQAETPKTDISCINNEVSALTLSNTTWCRQLQWVKVEFIEIKIHENIITSDMLNHHLCTPTAILNLSALSTIGRSCEHSMISLMVQELACRQTTDRQTDTQTDSSENNSIVTATVVTTVTICIFHFSNVSQSCLVRVSTNPA